VSLLVVYIKSVVRQDFLSGIFSGNYIRRENIKTKKNPIGGEGGIRTHGIKLWEEWRYLKFKILPFKL